MSEWVANLTEQWGVVMTAPIPFVAALIVLGSLIWAAVNWSYKSILNSKDAEISLIQRQRDDYKDELGGASPAEARMRIDRLEA